MISMKLTPTEAKSETMLGEASELPEYPCGLTICLNDDILDKLGITELPKIGTVMTLTAKVEVCSTSQYQNQDGADTSMSLQITDMDLNTGSEQPDLATRMYG